MTESSGNLTILAISDPEFLPRLRALASSINRNMPSAVLRACLVNVDVEDEAARLRAIHPRTECSFVRETLDDTVVKLGMDGITTFTEKAGFCVNLRARLIHRLLIDGASRVLFLDADSLVRKDLTRLIRLMDGSDIVIHKRPGAADYMRVAGGVIGVTGSARSIAFIERLIARIDQIGSRLFFADQLAFHLTAVECGGDITITHLPSEYIDWEFQDESFIWVGKGQRKHTNEAYLKEEARYGAASKVHAAGNIP